MVDCGDHLGLCDFSSMVSLLCNHVEIISVNAQPLLTRRDGGARLGLSDNITVSLASPASYSHELSSACASSSN